LASTLPHNGVEGFAGKFDDCRFFITQEEVRTLEEGVSKTTIYGDRYRGEEQNASRTNSEDSFSYPFVYIQI
jgi:hypothetical protein